MTAGSAADELVVIVVYVPHDDADALRRALDEAGAGRIGDYRGCSWSTSGTGRFTPLEGAQPTIGAVGQPEEVAEDRVEVVAPRDRAREIVEQMLAAHPYEEPAYQVIPMLTLDQL
ncbi:MAG: hypothetical protein ACTHZ5_04010 [Micrococcaceae bacterium]